MKNLFFSALILICGCGLNAPSAEKINKEFQKIYEGAPHSVVMERHDVCEIHRRWRQAHYVSELLGRYKAYYGVFRTDYFNFPVQNFQDLERALALDFGAELNYAAEHPPAKSCASWEKPDFRNISRVRREAAKLLRASGLTAKELGLSEVLLFGK